jgi:hypothetical protein
MALLDPKIQSKKQAAKKNAASRIAVLTASFCKIGQIN